VLLGLGLAVEEAIDGRRTAHDDEPDHDHDDFDSFVVELPAVARPEELAERVARAAEAGGVLRVKGFAAVEGKPMRLVVQAVGSRVSHHYDRRWAEAEAPATRLGVIGLKGLDRDAVTRILAA
jgi:cobalamin biosynthesis protein CobW